MALSRCNRAAAYSLAFFAIISVAVVAGLTQQADVDAVQGSAALRTPAMIGVMQLLSSIGNWRWEIPFAFGTAGLLWWLGARRRSVRFIACCAIGEAVYALTKLAFHRPRPTIASHLSQVGGYSYPSGHSMLAPIIWGFGLILLAEVMPSRILKTLMWIAAVVLALGIAASRVYLGVHYPSDVIAGLVLGVTWVLLWFDAVHCREVPAAVS